MAGLKQIKIPIKVNECTIENIVPYLTTVYQDFKDNATKIREAYNLYCLEHEINHKIRPHDDENNNIVLSPHIRSMVQWKTGYVLGNPIKYAQSKSTQTDDITTLNKYVRQSKKMTIDKQVGEWSYSCGVGYYFIQPKSVKFDVEYEAPFDIYCVDADMCGKVYSSYLGNQPLFDFLYTELDEIDKNGSKKTRKIMTLYLPTMVYDFETTNGRDFKEIRSESRGLYRYLPLVEQTYHNGIGISQTAISLQNAIDAIASDSVDNISDVVNEVLCFLNVSLGKTNEEKSSNLRAMKKLGAIELMSPHPDLPTDIKSIVTKLNITEVMSARQILLREMYDTNGVPIASSDVSSGNITKGGGEVANGYENAYNRALDDKNCFIIAQQNILERIVFICHKTPNCNLDSLQASEIEIKYCFNMSDNILTKTQAYVNLTQMGVPPAMALEKTKLSNDSEAEGIIIEEYIKAQAQATQEQQSFQNNGGIINTQKG